MNICLYGSASDKIDESYKTAVFELGKKLANRGHKLVFGGGANGLMGAAARGVKAVGGKIKGVIPEFFSKDKIEATYDACDELVLTDTMYDRKEILEEDSDAFIIVPGGIGTFDEFFAVLTDKQLSRHNKPMAIYDINGFFAEIKALMEKATEKKFVTENVAKIYSYFTDADEILDFIESDEAKKTVTHLKDG